MSNGNGKPPDESNTPAGLPKLTTKKEWHDVFLGALKASAHVSHSCEIAGVSTTIAYRDRQENDRFAVEWKEALESGVGKLEMEGRRRALTGTTKPIYHQGEKCGEVQEYSDVLLMFLLKAHKPEVYRERSDVNVKHSGTVDFRIAGMSPEESLDELDKELAALGRKLPNFQNG